jgi:hypothetical protein
MEVSALVSILAPCLSLLMAGASAAAQEIGKSVAPELLEHAKRLWAKLRPHVAAKPAATEAAEDVAADPADPRRRAALELQLEKLLHEQPQLAHDLAPLLAEAQAAGVVALGERSVAVGGSVASSVIVTGDNAVVRE